MDIRLPLTSLPEERIEEVSEISSEASIDQSQISQLVIKRQRRAVFPGEYDNIVCNTPPEKIANIDPEIFKNLTSEGVQRLSSEQIMQLIPEQVTALPSRVFALLMPQQIAQLNALVFRKLSADYLNHLPLAKRASERIPQITTEQLSQIPVEVFFDLNSGFLMSLKPRQISTLSGEQLAEINPEIFKHPSIIYFISALNKNQFSELTANQIRAISPKNFQKLFSDYLERGQNLLENFKGGQLRLLTEDQISVAIQLTDNKFIMKSYLMDYFRTMPEYEVRKLTQQEIRILGPDMLQQLGTAFLKKLNSMQLDWFTENQLKVFKSEDIQSARQQSKTTEALIQTRLRRVKQAYLSQISSTQLAEKNPDFFTKLSASDISVLSPSQIEKMTPTQISAQKADFFHYLNTKQLVTFGKIQRQAISPEVFTKLTIENFWGKLVPLQSRLIFIDPKYQRFFSLSQFHAIIQSLTPEQVAGIPVEVYQKMGDEFLLAIQPPALAKVPAKVFRYVTQNFVKDFNLDQVRSLNARQVLCLRLKVFSHLRSEQISAMDSGIFGSFTKEHIGSLNSKVFSALKPLQVVNLKSEVFANITRPDIQNLDPKIFSIIRVEHLNALADIPADKVNNGEKNHPIQWLTEAQIQKIPRELIGKIHSHFFEKLTQHQWDSFRLVQLQEISVENILKWKTDNSFLYQKLVAEKDSLFFDQRTALEVLPHPFSGKRKQNDVGDPAVQSPEKKVRLERRQAVLLFVPKTELYTNQLTEFRSAVENLRSKHPESAFYALSWDENERLEQWQLHDSQEKLATSWKTLEDFPQGEYDKVILLGHGENQLGRFEDIHYVALVEAIAKWTRNISKIKHLSILACGIKAELGVMLYRKLYQESPMFGKVPLLKVPEIDRITGSELPVYIAGNGEEGTSKNTAVQVGNRLYQDKQDGKIKHGVSDAKWEVKRNVEGKIEITSYLLPTHGNGTIIRDTQQHAGPFGYARLQQEKSEAEAAVRTAMEITGEVGNEVREKAASISHKTNKDSFVAVLEKIKEETGKYLIPVVNLENGLTHDIEISLERAQVLKTAQETLKFSYEPLKPFIERESTGQLRMKGIEGAQGHSGTMNGAFFAMALLRYIKETKLSDEEKLSVYWNLGGLGVAVAGDGVELGKLVSEAMGSTVERSLQTLGRVFEGANIVFMVGSVGWDSYELAATDDPVKRVGLAIGLGFNLGALGLQGGSMGMSLLMPAAAGTLGAIGSLAVPLMGVGFGFSVFGEQIARNNQAVHEFYKFFIEYFKECDGGVYTKKENILIPPVNVPIAEINYRTQKIKLGNVRLAKSRQASGGWIQRLSGAAPSHVYIFGKGYDYFDVLNPKAKTVHLDTTASAVILSDMPPVDMNYNYIDSLTTKSSEETKIDHRMQTMGEFEPNNWWKNLKPKAQPNYCEATQKVVLDGKTRVLYFPPRRSDSHMIGKVRFVIECGGGRSILRGLYSGVKVTLKDEKKNPSSIILEVPQGTLLGSGDVSIVANGNSRILKIKCQENEVIEVDITDVNPDSKMIFVGKGQTIRNLDLITGESKIHSLDLRGAERAEILLNRLTDQGQLMDLVSLTQGFLLPVLPKKEDANEENRALYQKQLEEAEKISIRILWDTKNRRIMAPGENYPTLSMVSLQGNKVLEPWLGIRQAGFTQKYAFFFNTEEPVLIQTDRRTNQQIARYKLRFFSNGSRIEGITRIGDQIFAKQVIPLGLQNEEVTLIHMLQEDKINLLEVIGLNHKHFQKFTNFSDDFLTDLRAVKTEGSESDQAANLMEVFSRQLQLGEWWEPSQPLLSAEISEWVKISGRNSRGTMETVFLNLEKGYIVNTGGNDDVLVKSWSYSSSVGGMGILLWSRKKKTARFVKLTPGKFNPIIIREQAVGNSALGISHFPQKISSGINPPGRFHKLAENQKVTFFEEYGQIYLVTEEGKQIFAVNCYGEQMSLQYQVQTVSQEKMDAWQEENISLGMAEAA